MNIPDLVSVRTNGIFIVGKRLDYTEGTMILERPRVFTIMPGPKQGQYMASYDSLPGDPSQVIIKNIDFYNTIQDEKMIQGYIKATTNLIMANGGKMQ